MMTKIDLCDGKYSVMHDNGADLHAVRYGEPWRDLIGDGLVLALVQEVERLRELEAHIIRSVPAREAFENAAYAHYQAQRAAGHFDEQAEEGDGSRTSLFWMTPDGNYGVRMFNAAWWGWRKALGL